MACCENRNGQGPGLGSLRFPHLPDKRIKWINAVNKNNWTPSKLSRICDDHFISGMGFNSCITYYYVLL